MTDEKGTGSGPVPVRDLMKRTPPETAAGGEPEWRGDEREFDLDGARWVARTAGAGSYGTGRRGTARLLAVHFFRDDEPETPVREALLPAAEFPNLRDPELRTLFQRATPIVVDS